MMNRKSDRMSLNLTAEEENLLAVPKENEAINNNNMFQLDVDNILLRGSSLRNTEWVFGIAIYTGHQTKVMMNSAKSQQKFSKIERWTNKFITLGILL